MIGNQWWLENTVNEDHQSSGANNVCAFRPLDNCWTAGCKSIRRKQNFNVLF